MSNLDFFIEKPAESRWIRYGNGEVAYAAPSRAKRRGYAVSKQRQRTVARCNDCQTVPAVNGSCWCN